MSFKGGIHLAGKRALVVGASRGIGRAIAVALAEAGADVAVAARTLPDVEELAREIEQLGRRGLAVGLDVGDIEAIAPVIEHAADRLGGLDILINSAGTTIRKPATEFTSDEWDQVLTVNLKGLFFTCQAAARLMIAQGSGRIVSIASATSHGAVANIALYGASKGGVSALTRHMALEWAPLGVTVNALAPGWVRTAMTAPRFADPVWAPSTLKRIPAARFAEPEDMAGLAVFLASDHSAYLTGQTIYVDGGLTIELTTRP